MKPSAEQQKQKILDAAGRIFAEAGFAGARVDAIAAAAGINKRLLYHYIGAKAALFRAVIDRELGRLTDASLADAALWRLVLEEAAQAGERRLLNALAARVSSTAARVSPNKSAEADALNPLDPRVSRTLAEAMYRALLADGSEPPQPVSAQKPRIRMQPRLVAAQAAGRSEPNRSK